MIDAPSAPAPDDPLPASGAPPSNLRRLVWGFPIREAPYQAPRARRRPACAVTPWPHQVRAFDRMYGGGIWPTRLLIADEVGLGKTVQAGLLIRQALLSGRARRILIMIPRNVRSQWQVELHARPPARTFRGGRSLGHRGAGRGTPRSPQEPAGSPTKGGPNALLRLMQGLRRRTQALLFLTATPMQVDPGEVWDLLDLLGLPTAWTAEAFVCFFREICSTEPVPRCHGLAGRHVPKL